MSIGATAAPPPPSPTLALERGFYLFMTIWIAALAVIGFMPKSLGIMAGAVPNPPLIVHVHAAIMVSWIALLVAQAALVGAGRTDLHMKLGLAALALIPLILVVGALTTVVRYYDAVEVGAGPVAANILFVQARFFVMFPLFIIWALAVRYSDPAAHKRLIILATLVPLGAAFGRMAFVPGNDMALTYDWAALIELIALAPALIYDFVRCRRLHRVYVIGLALTAVWLIAAHVVWNAPWWRAVADAFMGV